MLDNDKIVEMLDAMDKSVEALEKELIKLTWVMRGGINLEQAYALSTDQRIHVAELYEDHLEITKESQLPFF